MSYYDNVKDSVKDKKGGKGSSNFDMLREEAEKNTDNDDEGDDTDIEVLEEGLRKNTGSSSQAQRQPQKQSQQQQSQNQGAPINNQQQQNQQQPAQSSAPQQSASKAESMDTSGLEKKLDRIIEQNDRMIEILESFGQ